MRNIDKETSFTKFWEEVCRQRLHFLTLLFRFPVMGIFFFFFFFLLLFFFFYKIKFLLYPNLSIYVCETPSWRLEFRPLPPHLTSIYICRRTTAPRVCGCSNGNLWLVTSAANFLFYFYTVIIFIFMAGSFEYWFICLVIFGLLLLTNISV